MLPTYVIQPSNVLFPNAAHHQQQQPQQSVSTASRVNPNFAPYNPMVMQPDFSAYPNQFAAGQQAPYAPQQFQPYQPQQPAANHHNSVPMDTFPTINPEMSAAMNIGLNVGSKFFEEGIGKAQQGVSVS
jgi:hypothetical protein